MNYDLYVITDEAIAGGLTHAEIAERATAGGSRCYPVKRQDLRVPGTLQDWAGTPHDHDENRNIVHRK